MGIHKAFIRLFLLLDDRSNSTLPLALDLLYQFSLYWNRGDLSRLVAQLPGWEGDFRYSSAKD